MEDRVVVDEGRKVAYLLRELRTSPEVFSIVSTLKNRGVNKFNFVSYEELLKLKEEYGSFQARRQEDEEGLSSVLQELARLLSIAVKERSSDLHIRTDENKGEVLIRKHGLLVRTETYSRDFVHSMMRAFYQSLKVAEANYVETDYQVAQFSRQDVNIEMPREIVSVRVQRGPKLNGQYMVLRLLYSDTRSVDLPEGGEEERLSLGVRMLVSYGYLERQAREIVKTARQSAGIGVFAGPTGSGKSTALKTVLEFQHIIYPWKAIYTIEDPPEYPIRGAVQLPVLGKDRENKFAEALKVCMRSDPDIIMVGEVRDPETADLVVNASLTGHQVWTTVHAVHSFAVFPRLEGLGVSPDKLLETGVLKLVVAQRLLPKLCEECKLRASDSRVRKMVDKDIYMSISPYADLVFFKNPQGCEKCGGTGVSGRVVSAECLSISPSLLEEIKKHGAGAVYEEWRRENVDMIKHGLLRVLSGDVDPLDVIAHVGEYTAEDLRVVERLWKGL